MLTKTKIKILQVFTSFITKNFSPTDISKITGIDYKHAYTIIKSLKDENFLVSDHNLYKLNYKNNFQHLSYIENTKCEEFLKSKKNRFVKLLVIDVLNEMKLDFFIFIIFGSTINESNPKDTDIFIIVENKEEIDKVEKQIQNIATTLKLDIHVHFKESVYEMLAKREDNNLVNEILNKHLIFYGAETFYRMLAKGR